MLFGCVFVGVGMEKLYLAFVFMPFVLGALLFLLTRRSVNPVGSLAWGTALLWIVFVGHFAYQFSSTSMNVFATGWGHLNYSEFFIGMEVDFLSLIFSIINSILLLLTMVSISVQKDGQKSGLVCLAFVVTGLVNCAFMATSLYTFFILSEVIFLIHYACRVLSKEKVMLMRVLNTVAITVLFLIILYVGDKGGALEWDGELTPIKKLVFFGMVLYFATKLFFFPFYGNPNSHPLNVINNLLVGNTAFFLYIYGVKKYVIDIFPVEYKEHASLVAFAFAVLSGAFCMLSVGTRNFGNRQFFINKSLTCLMLGAFLSFDEKVDMGIFTLLISHVFVMIAFQAFFDGRKSPSLKYSKKEAFLLAVIFYSLAFFPLSGNFIGFCKILSGYKSMNLYALFVIFIGVLFLLMALMKEFFKLLEEGFSEKILLHKGRLAVISICLAIVFLIGTSPMIFENIM